MRCDEHHSEVTRTKIDRFLTFVQLEVILASQALNLGRSWWTVASQIATLANFYLTTWEEYHTGTRTSVARLCLTHSTQANYTLEYVRALSKASS